MRAGWPVSRPPCRKTARSPVPEPYRLPDAPINLYYMTPGAAPIAEALDPVVGTFTFVFETDFVYEGYAATLSGSGMIWGWDGQVQLVGGYMVSLKDGGAALRAKINDTRQIPLDWPKPAVEGVEVTADLIGDGEVRLRLKELMGGMVGLSLECAPLWGDVDMVVEGRFHGMPGSRRTDFNLWNAYNGKILKKISFETRL